MCTPARYNVGLAPPSDAHLDNFNCTELPTDGGAADLRCRYISFEYDLTTSVVCGLSLIFGILYSLFGYRCFRAVMFLTGFTFGAAVVYIICLEEAALPPLGNAGVSLAAGALLGTITALVQYVGLFMTGFHTGLYCGVITLIVLDLFHRLVSVWISIAVLLGCGLLLALANLRLQKSLTVVGTSVHGAAVVAVSMDYFVEQLAAARWVAARLRLRPARPPCWYSWLLLAVWPLVALVGVLVQARITGRGTHHKVAVPHKSRTVHLQRLRSRQARAELRQRKYRYLYQVRTAHGDIISQEYVQSLSHKMAAPAGGDSSSLQSDCTRVTGDHEPVTALTALSEGDEPDPSTTETAGDSREYGDQREYGDGTEYRDSRGYGDSRETYRDRHL